MKKINSQQFFLDSRKTPKKLYKGKGYKGRNIGHGIPGN